ncbi:ABC transporter permease subunit [Lysobacter sp. N42]|uniref:ABC transporter permease subunit n=2 Tax=Gammaproteobacteria TaxID=1236 RepID=UPI001A9DC7CA|nr:ABC transporter permease subunit [Lysobacter sp. N42]
MPILKGADVEQQASFELPVAAEQGNLEHLIMERYQEMGVAFTDQGQITFFDAFSGAVEHSESISDITDAHVSSFAHGENLGGLVGFGLDNGEVLFAKPDYELNFPNDQREITPSVAYPYGNSSVVLDPQGAAIELLTVQESTRGRAQAMAVGYTADQRFVAARVSTRENLFTGQLTSQVSRFELPGIPGTPKSMIIDKSFRNLFVADTDGHIHYIDLSSPNAARWVESVNVTNDDITAMEFLVGSVSVIVGTSEGELSQWFLVRDEDNNYSLERIRDFDQHAGAITSISAEYTRKGFVATDATGGVGLHYGTSSRTLFLDQIAENTLPHVAMSPVDKAIFTLGSDGLVTNYSVWNEHPQLSFKALWNKVWYEGRAEPQYVWQSSSASDEFESKFSLIPLSIGTLKAAFFAMLFAMPLGIMAAIYTAYFMTPKLRGVVKPTIEIMEALPTVILGFLAGLWLAPFMESNLPAVFTTLIGLPIMMLLMAFAWKSLPENLRNRVPAGWEAALLVPIVLLFGTFAVVASPYMEVLFFDGSMRQWLTDNGITYDQRNALVVGVAMGFAVIPTIYSIAEDAVFNVPKHLTQGSLALGATPWQTMMGVVLPTASPGIFSALMIGFGRAVGETMIVLMATGNSPIVNFNIFEGMRTLSANIAVELPETAVGSSHFRILFLAALVLFTFTFILNTIAEVVRQRLRARYSSL